MDKKNYYKIAKIKIGSEELKRIEIYYNVLENKLIFIGSAAHKTTEVVKTWKEYVYKEVDFNQNLTYDFENAVQEIYDEMVEKEKTLELLQGLFKNVDAVEIKE